MSRNKTAWIVMILSACVVATAYAAYLEGDEPKEEAPVRIVPPPPRPIPANPLTEMVGRLTVREGYHYRGLTVFLVELARISDDRPYLSTQEALARDVLVVQEKGGGTVPRLIVENQAKEPVLMLGGEVLLGGKQNRILREDVLLPARSGPVEVTVLCIEQGRWSGKGVAFDRAASVAPSAVRSAVQAGKAQEEVWQGVTAYHEAFRVESGTRDLQAVQDSPEVQKTLKEYREQFAEHCWRPEAVGMVVARYGGIVGADIFCNAAVFQKHRDRLLESYAIDHIAHPIIDQWEKRLSRDDAQQFLRRVVRAEFTWRGSPGEGRLLTAKGAGLDGTALVYRDNVLHACLMAAEAEVIIRRPLRPVPLPRPQPIPEE